MLEHRIEASQNQGVDMQAKLGQLTHELRDHERHLLEQLRRRRTVARNINIVHNEQLSTGDRISDGIAATVGSWRFIIIQSLALATWLFLNVVAWVHHWDPYPFILLNLVLSFQAAYTAPIIMMSQNRQSEKDRLRAENDYETNIKAELEIVDLHHKLDELRSAQWNELIALQQRQLVLLDQLIMGSRDADP